MSSSQPQIVSPKVPHSEIKLTIDLYATDFRRAQFKSFLDILQARCISFDMRSKHDYRKPLNNLDPSGYFLPDQPGWDETCTHVLGKLVPPTTLTVYSRSIAVPIIGVTGAAKFNFSELCGANLGPADYLTIASTFPIMYRF